MQVSLESEADDRNVLEIDTVTQFNGETLTLIWTCIWSLITQSFEH